MSDHYYSKKPEGKEKLSTWETKLNNESYTFTTSSGVFSKHEVDFGSRLLIETIKKPDIQAPILDLGCGYGPIGLSLARKYPKDCVQMLDINERAVKMAKLNAEKNQIKNVAIKQSDGFQAINEDERFSLIVTNPPIRVGKKVMYALLEKSKKFLVQNGELWLVIQKKQGSPSAIKFLEEHFTLVNVEARKKGYFIIRAVNN